MSKVFYEYSLDQQHRNVNCWLDQIQQKEFFQTLYRLYRVQSCPSTELTASNRNVSKTVYDRLKELEQIGLISAVKDGKTVTVSITDAGKKMVESILVMGGSMTAVTHEVEKSKHIGITGAWGRPEYDRDVLDTMTDYSLLFEMWEQDNTHYTQAHIDALKRYGNVEVIAEKEYQEMFENTKGPVEYCTVFRLDLPDDTKLNDIFTDEIYDYGDTLLCVNITIKSSSYKRPDDFVFTKCQVPYTNHNGFYRLTASRCDLMFIGDNEEWSNVTSSYYWTAKMNRV